MHLGNYQHNQGNEYIYHLQKVPCGPSLLLAMSCPPPPYPLPTADMLPITVD